MNLPFSGADLSRMASKGSPSMLRFVGRAFGLGTAEQDALVQGAFPGWFWAVLGAVGGAYGGVQLQRHYPRLVARILEAK